MTKKERLERFNEFTRRGFDREAIDVILQLEESNEKLRARVSKLKKVFLRRIDNLRCAIEAT